MKKKTALGENRWPIAPIAAAKPPRSSGPPGGRLRLLLNVKALIDASVAGEADAARAQAEASRRA